MIRRLAVLALCAALSGCGSDGLTTAQVDPRSPPATRNFGDVDPVNFPGRGPDAHAVHGIDTARYQGQVDWRTARAAGVGFAFIKATEGGDRLDPGFVDNWTAAADAGVPRGTYHFYYFCTPAAEQARWFIENVPRQPGSLPPVLDLEWNPFSPTCTHRPPPAEVRRQARIFLDIVERHFGERPIVYTTPDFWERNGIGRMGEEVWLRSVAEHPAEVYPGADWRFWQYTATGRVAGVSGDVDLNAFSGSRADWARWRAARSID